MGKLLNQTLFLYGKPNKGILTILKNLVKQNNIRISDYNRWWKEQAVAANPTEADGTKSTIRFGTKLFGNIQEEEEGMPLAAQIKNIKNKSQKNLYNKNLPMFMISIADITDESGIRRYVTTMSEVDNTTPNLDQKRNTKAEAYTLMLKNAGFCVSVDLPTGWGHDEATITSRGAGHSPGGITYVIPYRYVDKMRYVPFKRLKYKTPTKFPQPTCNNGSLCSEPKLFSWLRSHHVSLRNIHGYGCMWIHNGGESSLTTGSGYAPISVEYGAPAVGHMLLSSTDVLTHEKAFVYKHARGAAWTLIRNKAEDIDRGEEEQKPCVVAAAPAGGGGGVDADEEEEDGGGDSTEYLDQVVDWLAFPCPGCQMNYFDIVYGKPVAWNDKDCVIRNQHGEPLASGQDVFSGHGGSGLFEGEEGAGNKNIAWSEGKFVPEIMAIWPGVSSTVWPALGGKAPPAAATPQGPYSYAAVTARRLGAQQQQQIFAGDGAYNN